MNFYLYLPHLLSNLGDDMHIMLLSVYDLCLSADRKPYFSYEHK